MSTIAYSLAVALIGSGAAVASQIVVSPGGKLMKPASVAVTVGDIAPSYDFDKFAEETVPPLPVESAAQGLRLKPVRVAALTQSDLKLIVRDEALAQKVDKLAAAADAQISSEREGVSVVGEEVSVPLVESPAIVPVPKLRPAAKAMRTRSSATRTKRKATKRQLQRPIRVAEASTSRQSRLAKRLRSKGWLIGAFR